MRRNIFASLLVVSILFTSAFAFTLFSPQETHAASSCTWRDFYSHRVEYTEARTSWSIRAIVQIYSNESRIACDSFRVAKARSIVQIKRIHGLMTGSYSINTELHSSGGSFISAGTCFITSANNCYTSTAPDMKWQMQTGETQVSCGTRLVATAASGSSGLKLRAQTEIAQVNC